jgi:hypothetical protein
MKIEKKIARSAATKEASVGETQYYRLQLESFSRKHPAHQGWHVCNVERYFVQSELSSLPEFLADSVARHKIKKIKIVHKLICDCTAVADDMPGPDRLEKADWKGEAIFEWRGAEIHILCFDLYADCPRTMFFMAVKSLDALQHLWQALRRYNRKRLKTDRIEVPFGTDITMPKVSWDEIVLPNDMVAEIKSAAEAFFAAKDKYKTFGLAYRRGFLFTGAPGGGKTMMIKAIVSNLAVPCVAYRTKGSDNDTERIESAFMQAANKAPSILLLEDLDKFKVDLSAVLNMLDGLDTPRGVLTIATANDPEKLDPALLLRPSRFDRVWSFPLPAFEQRLRFLTSRSSCVFSGPALEDAAKGSQGFSMAYVQEILATALTCAMNDNREPNDGDLALSLDKLKKQVKTSQEAPRELGKQSSGVGFTAECQNA